MSWSEISFTLLSQIVLKWLCLISVITVMSILICQPQQFFMSTMKEKTTVDHFLMSSKITCTGYTCTITVCNTWQIDGSSTGQLRLKLPFQDFEGRQQCWKVWHYLSTNEKRWFEFCWCPFFIAQHIRNFSFNNTIFCLYLQRRRGGGWEGEREKKTGNYSQMEY